MKTQDVNLRRAANQRYWNSELTFEERAKLLDRFDRWLERHFRRLGLVAMCTDCLSVMTVGDLEDGSGGCIQCHRHDVATPYEC